MHSNGSALRRCHLIVGICQQVGAVINAFENAACSDKGVGIVLAFQSVVFHAGAVGGSMDESHFACRIDCGHHGCMTDPLAAVEKQQVARTDIGSFHLSSQKELR